MTRTLALLLIGVALMVNACERQDYSESRNFSRHGLDPHDAAHGGHDAHAPAADKAKAH